MDDLAYAATSISFPKAVSENKLENYREYGGEIWTKTNKGFMKFKQRKEIFTILNNP